MKFVNQCFLFEARTAIDKEAPRVLLRGTKLMVSSNTHDGCVDSGVCV